MHHMMKSAAYWSVGYRLDTVVCACIVDHGNMYSMACGICWPMNVMNDSYSWSNLRGRLGISSGHVNLKGLCNQGTLTQPPWRMKTLDGEAARASTYLSLLHISFILDCCSRAWMQHWSSTSNGLPYYLSPWWPCTNGVSKFGYYGNGI